MYKGLMATSIINGIAISTLSLKPGITIWYCKIPHIIRAIFSKNIYHNYRPVVNEIFKKNDFNEPIFNTQEINAVNGFRAFKKQIEWLCGRYLVKQLLHLNYLTKYPLEKITLGYLEQGAPYVAIAPDLPISISHSNDYTAAAAAADRTKIIGLDIEKIQKKPDKYFLKTAFTQKEISQSGESAEMIFKNWTIKEAYLKYIKKGFNESLHKVEILDNEIRHNNKKVDLDVHSIKFEENYILSMVSD
ncbi:MAG: 4'-phosphopantetheinyl transferase superfamily protein [Desulfobacula sp.]|nr:4'-phosphopantetheinyl transferase superfamily protein [Desulfobacula sp.]